MNKPKSLDTAGVIALNTLISCHGAEHALEAYRANCQRVFLPPEPWAIRYLTLYAKYRSKKKNSLDNYIDVRAAKRALEES